MIEPIEIAQNGVSSNDGKNIGLTVVTKEFRWDGTMRQEASTRSNPAIG
jgi:hypothetical protein